MQPIIVVVERRRYGFGHFLFDLVMTGLTSGIWLVWVVIRECKRKNS